MKIVIAPDSFKESLSALDVASEIEAGFREIFPTADYLKIPVADGGEGTVDAMIAATDGQRIDVEVAGPLGTPVQAFYGLLGDGKTAVIEMAAASGLELVPPAQRNPLLTTTFGTGQLIRAALDAGARHCIIGLGGSATNDGGAGMLQALGGGLLDASGKSIPPGGGGLAKLAQIKLEHLDPRLEDCIFEIACDVSNPLLGPQGASAIFGPQKGATPEMVGQLEANLSHFAQLILRDFGLDLASQPGTGAAGGMSLCLIAFLNGTLRPGVEIVTDAIHLAAAIKDADLVITGEGRIDSQSIRGKTPVGVARLAQAYGIPVIAIGGCLAADTAAVYQHGIAAAFAAVNRPCSLETALNEARANLRSAARNIAACLKIGQRLPPY
jgi:glycerate kinase